MNFMILNKTDIIIFGGQSNMQGQSETLLNNDVTDGCFEYCYLTDSFDPLKNPVGEFIKTDGSRGEPFGMEPLGNEDELVEWLKITALGASTDGNTNLVPSFCKAYRQKTGRDVMAIHAAKGSTRICQWLPGQPEHEMLMKKAKAGIGKCQNKGRIYFVWLQGESDACASVKQDQYEKELTELKDLLKEKLGIDKFGIIRVGRFAGDSRDDEIINAQDNVCACDSDFVMLTRIATELNEIPEYMNPYVSGHYSAKGLELLGKTAGEALGEFSKQN